MGDEICPMQKQLQLLQQRVGSLEQQVNTDHLTQLYNKKHFWHALSQELDRTQRSLQPTTLIMMDIDHFKSFNDNYGHLVGDKVLAHLASLITDSVRSIDIACRYGGEEFTIILPSTPLLVGAQVAERLRSRVEQSPLVTAQDRLNITISLGVDVCIKRDALTPEQLVASADRQLYRAKQQGRNQVQCAAHELSSSSQITQNEKDALFNLE